MVRFIFTTCGTIRILDILNRWAFVFVPVLGTRIVDSVSEWQRLGEFWMESSRIPDNTRSQCWIFCPTPEVQLDLFLHHTPKLGIPVEMLQFLLKLC